MPWFSAILDGKKKIDPQIRKDIATYTLKAKNKSEIERQSEGKEKTGVFTGLYCHQSFDGLSNADMGFGFCLGWIWNRCACWCPRHDKRDFEFATKFG